MRTGLWLIAFPFLLAGCVFTDLNDASPIYIDCSRLKSSSGEEGALYPRAEKFAADANGKAKASNRSPVTLELFGDSSMDAYADYEVLGTGLLVRVATYPKDFPYRYEPGLESRIMEILIPLSKALGAKDAKIVRRATRRLATQGGGDPKTLNALPLAIDYSALKAGWTNPDGARSEYSSPVYAEAKAFADDVNLKTFGFQKAMLVILTPKERDMYSSMPEYELPGAGLYARLCPYRCANDPELEVRVEALLGSLAGNLGAKDGKIIKLSQGVYRPCLPTR